MAVPYVDERAAEEVFRHKVLALLRRRGLLSGRPPEVCADRGIGAAPTGAKKVVARHSREIGAPPTGGGAGTRATL